MKLLTEGLLQKFAKVGRQGENPLVIARYFNPQGAGTWFATEYDPETRLFYGFAVIQEGEWGDFSLDEMEAYRGRFGLGIERDMHFIIGRWSWVKEHDTVLQAL